MKILVLGNINGNFGFVNNLIEETKCDLVLCTGNVGMYYFHDKLLPKKQQNNNFYQYLIGKKKLLKPMVVVPGNRENYYLVSKFYSKKIEMNNFVVLGQGEKVIMTNENGAVGITGLCGSYSPIHYNQTKVIEFKYSNLRYFHKEDVSRFIENGKTNILLMHELVGPYIGKAISFTEDQLNIFYQTLASYCFVGRYGKWIHAALPRSYKTIEFISLPYASEGYGILDTFSWNFNGVNKMVEGE